MMRIMCATIPRKSSGLEKNWSILSSVLLESAQKKKEISIVLLGPKIVTTINIFLVLKHAATGKSAKQWKTGKDLVMLWT